MLKINKDKSFLTEEVVEEVKRDKDGYIKIKLKGMKSYKDLFHGYIKDKYLLYYKKICKDGEHMYILENKNDWQKILDFIKGVKIKADTE